ncbi:hypothetical protein [Candidatus Poriferisocius sp.]|uniref:hypothetical protein n=1 Tax=Candidatus Poriferisocius sp. TaxID=3101276 RepID=UPI003B02CD88
MNKTQIRLFLGQEIEDPVEQKLISRLRLDLEQRGVSGALYANFIPRPGQQRQIDLLVHTETHTAHVEIKGFNANYPVRGHVNGLWVQILADGTERQITNGSSQAIRGTYAISDAMRDLARKEGVAAVDNNFSSYIDTIVGLWEAIPEGSEIEPRAHVTVLGYQDLLERLVKPGPCVPWTQEEWDEFARRHSLFQPEDISPSEQSRRDSLEIIADYRPRARASLSDGLGPLVDLGATDNDGTELAADDIDNMVAAGRVVAITGHSGSGKTFFARHLVVRHCDAGRLVVWVRAADYEGRFSDLLNLATAPYSIERRKDVIRAAEETGVGISVVLDGLNECPESERTELLKQLKAFCLRHSAGVLVTSTVEEGLVGTLGAKILNSNEPDAETRLAILRSYGARQPERISDQFRSPHELAIAAECESELANGASVADLHDAFVRRHAPTVRVRAGLRSLAANLHSQFRTSMPQLDAASVLNSPSLESDARFVDEVLANPLIGIDRHRVRFRHELFGQFLAAEDLVRSSSTSQRLAAHLDLPVNKPLTQTALQIERNSHRIWDVIKALCDEWLMLRALTGDYGPEVAALAAADIRDILHVGIAAANPENASFEAFKSEDQEGFALGGRWSTSRRWSETELKLLAAAGRGSYRGLLVEEVCELIDKTDELCQTQARLLQADGITNPISTVVEATLSQMAHQVDRENCGLAMPYVAVAFEYAAMEAPFSGLRGSTGLAGRLANGAGDYSWGRYYLAMLAVNPFDPTDQAVFASLLRRAWDAGGSPLQLKALHTATDLGRHGGTQDPHRSEIVDVLRSIDTSNLILSTSLLEALAEFDEIESETTVEQVHDRIRQTISRPEDMESCRAARSIVAMQYETQEVVGPYREAIGELTDTDWAWLLTMAARGSDPNSWDIDSLLEQLSNLVPTGNAALDNAAKDVFASYLDGPPEDSTMPQVASAACRAAISGWAQFESEIPPGPNDPTPAQRSWHLIASLLLRHEQDDAAVDAETLWSALLSEPDQTVATLAHIDSTDKEHLWDRQARAHYHRRDLPQLAEDYPESMRRLFEWALDNLADIPTHPIIHRKGVLDFAIRMLGLVGTETTAEKLRVYTLDPKAGSTAVQAIRQINNRAAS